MNGRQSQGYVPHVGRAATALLGLACIWKDTTKRLGITAVENSHDRIVTHLRIGWTAAKDPRCEPVTRAPASKQRRTLARMVSRSSSVLARTIYRAVVSAGIIFGA